MSGAPIDNLPARSSGDVTAIDGPTQRITLLSWDQVERARAATANYTDDPDELAEWLMMLGIFPGQQGPAKIEETEDPRLSQRHLR